jgi:hypothetical protein
LSNIPRESHPISTTPFLITTANKLILATSFALKFLWRIVRDAVFPDPLSQRPIRLRDATAAINEYKRSTGDLAGAVDLMLEFVEAGTEQATDLGYGTEAYFAALERKVNEVVRSLGALPDADRADAEARLIELEQYCGHIGWGYGDFLGEVAASVRNRQARQTARQPRHEV